MSNALDLNSMFATKLIDFMEDLRGVLGHLPKFQLVSASIRFVPHAQLRSGFDLHVAQPYGKFIAARDEGFFLAHDALGGSNNIDIVPLLKLVWKTLSEPDKQSIWAHLQILMTINERVQQQQQQQQQRR
jgi:hypothetical protein